MTVFSDEVRFLGFDVFGTVVDWRSGVAAALEPFLNRHHAGHLDPFSIADQWRAQYEPAMERVRRGERAWVRLTILNRENLECVLASNGVDLGEVSDAELAEVNNAWERLPPWSDTVAGLTRLKRRFGIATFSNGCIANMVNLARYSSLPWDAVLGAEISQSYKPQPATYLKSVEALGVAPSQVAMVAAHNNDLAAARACGLKTVFIHRVEEYGPGQITDLAPDQAWDIVGKDLIDVARQMSC